MAIGLIAIEQGQFAHLLASYLKSQGVPAQVVEQTEPAQFVVVIEHEHDFEQAKTIAQEFIRQPNDPKYQQAAWQQGEQVNLRSAPTFSFAKILQNAIHAPFTSLVLVVCTVVFVLSYLGLFQPIASHLMMVPISTLLETHQWWRLIGPAFIHFSALHFVFNLLWWSTLGSQIERTMGVSMLLLVFVVSAVLSNIGQTLVTGPNFGGLSGVVYALMGFVWFCGWLRPQWGLSIQKPIIGFMLVWLVLGYADVLWVNMANTAHTVGLVSGCVMAWLLTLGSSSGKDT